jgi:adenylate cyclase
MGRLEEALEELKKNRNQKDITNHIRLAAVYILLGREKDASAEAMEILKLNPKFSIKSIARWPFKNKADIDFMITALRKAGLPE